MNLHIERDRFHRGILIWVEDGGLVYLPARDPYDLASIDTEAKDLLQKMLDIAESGSWGAYGIEPAKFAAAISILLETIQRTGPKGFTEAKFVCPVALAEAVSFPSTPVLVSQWLAAFPAVA